MRLEVIVGGTHLEEAEEAFEVVLVRFLAEDELYRHRMIPIAVPTSFV